jgi:carbonic anhydrase/acetyltransferase-like protein (isoleucine patch superfamily)
VVVNSIPSDCIAAGNPAKVVKHLDPQKSFTTRQQWFSKSSNLYAEIDQLDRQLLGNNTLRHWLRYLFFPHRGD